LEAQEVEVWVEEFLPDQLSHPVLRTHPKPVDNSVPPVVVASTTGVANNGVQLALICGDASEMGEESKLLCFLTMVVVLICLWVGM